MSPAFVHVASCSTSPTTHNQSHSRPQLLSRIVWPRVCLEVQIQAVQAESGVIAQQPVAPARPLSRPGWPEGVLGQPRQANARTPCSPLPPLPSRIHHHHCYCHCHCDHYRPNKHHPRLPTLSFVFCLHYPGNHDLRLQQPRLPTPAIITSTPPRSRADDGRLSSLKPAGSRTTPVCICPLHTLRPHWPSRPQP